MNAHLPTTVSDLWFIAAWTMIHFLWLGTVVAAAGFICRAALRRATPNVRYVTAFIFLAILAALPVVITGWLVKNAPPLANATSSALPTMAAQPLSSNDGAPVIELKTPGASLITPKLIVKNQPSDIQITARPSADEPASISTSSIENGITWCIVWFGRCIPYLPWLWLVGTPITFALLLTGLVGSRRLSTASRPIVDGPIAELFAQLISSLKSTRRVTIAICDRIAAPVLVGIVRPMILLPPAALTGWSPDELEMVLLHELAHVRRWDNLINLLQRCLESLLFFHPAVWLISSWVRDEREACCDAAVVARTNRPHAYAELLVALAADLPRSVLFHPAAASAMSAGPLRSRIRRILQLENDPMLISGKSFALMAAAFTLAATLGVLYLPTSGHAEPSATEKIETAEPGPSETDSSDSSAEHTKSEFPHTVQFELGAHRFLEGDNVTISEVRGTAKTFEPENKYRVKGTYNLSSHDRAQLSAFVTVNDPAHAKSNIEKLQTKRVDRGQGEFTLTFSVKHEGSPHVSFYPADHGESFGGIYFGTGDSVLKKWWSDDKSSEEGANNAENKADAKQNDESSRLANFEAALKNVENVIVLFNGEKALRDTLHEWHKIAAKQTRSLYTYGFNVDPGSADAQRHSLTAAATCIVFRKGQEIGRLSPVVSDERLRKFLDAKFASDRTGGGPKVAPELLALFTREASAPTDEQVYKLPAPMENLFPELPELIDQLKKSNSKIAFSYNLTDSGKTLQVYAPSTVQKGYFQARISKWQDSVNVPPTHAMRPNASKFPSLEDQKLADLAWKLLNVELEPLSDSDISRVKALGYDGGVSVAGTTNVDKVNILTGDILIALHVWPTRSIKDVIDVLKRDDLADLNPLKFYVVRRQENFSGQGPDEVRTGRLNLVNLRTNPLFKANTEGQPTSISAQSGLPPAGTVQPANPVSSSAEGRGMRMAPQSAAPLSVPGFEPGGFAPQPIPAGGPADNAYIPTPTPQLSPVPVTPVGAANSAFGVPDPLSAPGQPVLNPTAPQAPGGAVFVPVGQANPYAWTPGAAPAGAPGAAPASAAPSAKSELLYDNKTFYQWFRQFDQAVSNRNSDLRALRALEAFAAAGMESEANKFILQGVYSDLVMAQHTRKYLSTLSKQAAAPLVEQLRTVLKTDLSPRRRTAALRALAALGPNSEPAMEDLKKGLTSKSQEESIAAATAIKRIVGKDQYQKPIADVLGDQLGIKVVKTGDGAWGAVPSNNSPNADAFNNFNDAVIKEQESLFPKEDPNLNDADF